MEKKQKAAEQQEITLVGIDLGHDTDPENGEAERHRAEIWQRFKDDNIKDKIPVKSKSEVILVLHRRRRPPVYQDPFRYFMGIPVDDPSDLPPGLKTLTIPAGSYHKESTSGAVPECTMQKWEEINKMGLKRVYDYDYEVYEENVLSTSDSQVDIYVSCS